VLLEFRPGVIDDVTLDREAKVPVAVIDIPLILNCASSPPSHDITSN